jgi:hypothetical protein
MRRLEMLRKSRLRRWFERDGHTAKILAYGQIKYDDAFVFDSGRIDYGFTVEVFSERIHSSGSNSTLSGDRGSLMLMGVRVP